MNFATNVYPNPWRVNKKKYKLCKVIILFYFSLSPWPVVKRVCFVLNLLNLTVTKFQEHISSEMWDLIMCSLVQWVASCEESRKVASFIFTNGVGFSHNSV